MNVETVLITGIAGLMGSRLADWIIENHPDVTVIGVDDLSGGYIDNVPENALFQQVDISNGSELDAWFKLYKPDVVYHFAAYAAECLSPFIRKYNYTNNLVATANVVNLCIKYNVKRLVFTSSMAVYGKAEPPFAEHLIPNPIDPYGVAKMACERDIQIAGEQHGLDWCILRPHNVYGVKQNIWDPYRNVIGIFMYKVLNNDRITIFGDGLQERAFSYIDDILEPMWKAGVGLRASKQIINLGGTESNTILDVANSVRDAAINSGTEVEAFVYLPPRHEVREAYSTYSKSVKLLDFDHKTDLKDGVRKMWEWAIEQPQRKRQIWSSYEIDEGLYSYWKPEALKDGYWK